MTNRDSVPLWVVDAFTTKPFAGNPAAVCLLQQAAPVEWMQAVAREMKHSETAFVLAAKEGYQLRWFTPTVEVKLCGHATLATAHVLYTEQLVAANQPVAFVTASGVLRARCDSATFGIELDFPVRLLQPMTPEDSLIRALGARPVFVGRDEEDLLVQLEDERSVANLTPDIGALKELPYRGVIVTARASGSDCDFVSRFFAPAVGVDEDPVTGSAHCCLAPFWDSRLQGDQRLQPQELRARQISRRTGELRLRLQGERVLLIGQATTVLKAELLV